MSIATQSNPNPGKSRPVLIAMSTLAALQVLTGGAALGDVIGVKTAGLLVLGVAAAQTGIQFYVQNLVVPVADVAAYKDKDGALVAGPAAPPPAKEPEDVDVIPADGIPEIGSDGSMNDTEPPPVDWPLDDPRRP